MSGIDQELVRVRVTQSWSRAVWSVKRNHRLVSGATLARAARTKRLHHQESPKLASRIAKRELAEGTPRQLTERVRV